MIKTPLEQLVARHEGYRQHIYRCSAGKLTIGYGYNLTAGMPEDEAHLLMRYRLTGLMAKMERRFGWFNRLSDQRKEVLLDMAYQLGFDGLLGFKRFLEYCSAGSFVSASNEMLDSKWARSDSPERAKELSEMMRNG